LSAGRVAWSSSPRTTSTGDGERRQPPRQVGVDEARAGGPERAAIDLHQHRTALLDGFRVRREVRGMKHPVGGALRDGRHPAFPDFFGHDPESLLARLGPLIPRSTGVRPVPRWRAEQVPG